ncbi:MAG TPA: gamma-glutamyltransferase [Myxococcota bacterium]|nr:gamma-glutamyltransferase [Myxococcota bacterium]
MRERPTAILRGFGGAVAAGHHAAAQIGAQLLANGGNAADAACAMGFALQVLEPHMNGPAGEVPILVHVASEGRTFAISGQGVAPAAATIARFAELGLELIPGDGLLAAAVPAALDAWCLLLEQFGTKTLAEVVAPAQSLAARGYPMYPFLRSVLSFLEPRFRSEWPSSAAVYLPLRAVGEAQTNPALAEFLGELIAAEGAAAGSREARIRAARDSFYRGRAAAEIERFLRTPVRDASGRSHAGLLSADDLASYQGAVEDPVFCHYRGARVWKCGPWSQGPVFLQQLRLLEGFALAQLGQNSADALHAIIECAKLAFADREASYGDPREVDVPLFELLGDAYTEKRRALVDPARASLELRPGLGRLPAGWPRLSAEAAPAQEPQAFAASRGRGDTTHLDAVDRDGNAVSATPSGGWIPSSPIVPALGFPVGTRLQMAVLDAAHPNSLAPGKRPRTTLSPSLARLPDGRILAFGTPGGDQQDQWTLQFFLNLCDFGARDLQGAIDAPTVHSHHMPDSFYPRFAQPGAVAAESRIAADVLDELERRGHRVRRGGPWEHGRVSAVARDPGTGLCEGAASPRFAIAAAAALP